MSGHLKAAEQEWQRVWVKSGWVKWSEGESGHKTNHLINHLEWILCLAKPRNCTCEKTMLWMETRFKAWRCLKVSTCGELSVELHPQSNSKTWINQVVVLFKLNFSSKTWRCQVLVGKFNFKLNFLGKFNFKWTFSPKLGGAKFWWVSSTLNQDLVPPNLGSCSPQRVRQKNVRSL